MTFRGSIRACGGFSLIEAMVALLIISIGLLGVFALQATGLNYNATASARSIAAIDAASMIALMRANVCGVTNSGAQDAPPVCDPVSDNAYSYANFSSENPLPGGHAAINAPAKLCRTAGVPCSTAEQAAADLWTMAQVVARDLPGGAIRVTCNDSPCTNTSWYTVTVSWLERDVARDAQGQAATATTAPARQSFSVVIEP